MNPKYTKNLWLIGLLMLLLGPLLAGCGSKTWSPTDPLLDEPDYENIQVMDCWEVSLTTEVCN